MKNAFAEIAAAYDSYIDSARIIVLFLCACCLIYYFNLTEMNEERRRINPTVFLLSLWSGIAYAFTLCIRKIKTWYVAVTVALMGIIAVSITGGFIFTDETIRESIYYYTNYVITIASVLSIISFFVIYYLISTELFAKLSDRGMFMLVVVVLHLFANYTIPLLRYSIFIYPLSIGSIILHDFMPLVMWVILLRQRHEESKPKEEVIEETADDYEEEWDLKKHKIINIRNMAIAFIVLAVCLVISAYVLNSKINNLYNVTVSLEKATEDKVSLYEFKERGGDDVIATLLVTGQGTTTLTGGGSAEYGQDLYDFVSQYTVRVDNWYIYGEDEENTGALYYCLNKGLIVDKIYCLTGLEQLGEDN